MHLPGRSSPLGPRGPAGCSAAKRGHSPRDKGVVKGAGSDNDVCWGAANVPTKLPTR
jgi:hypothetical protein